MMKRLVGALLIAGLLSALAPSAALASPFSDQIFLQVFGENTDGHHGFASTSADRFAESPLRELAFTVTIAPPAAPSGLTLAAAQPYSALLLSAPGAGLAAGRTPSIPAIAVTAAAAAQALDYYQAPAPAPTILSFPGEAVSASKPDDGSGRGGLVTFSPVMSAAEGFDAANDPLGRPAFGSGATVLSPSMALPVRVGPVHVVGHVAGTAAEDPASALRDNAYLAGANVTVPAFRRDLNVDVSGGVEHLTRDDTVPLASTSVGGTQAWQIPTSADVPSLVPAYADVTKQTMRAAVAVPVTPRVLLDVQYKDQHLFGAYGAPGLQNLNAQAATYGAGVTLAIPHTTGALSISARQYHYQDNVVPANTFTQTGGDVNFTVKF